MEQVAGGRGWIRAEAEGRGQRAEAELLPFPPVASLVTRLGRGSGARCLEVGWVRPGENGGLELSNPLAWVSKWEGNLTPDQFPRGLPAPGKDRERPGGIWCFQTKPKEKIFLL